MARDGLYLYCVGAPGHPAPEGVSGIDGAPTAARETAGLSAWVSELKAAPTPTLERIREHNRVVERACDERTALPLRFGQWFADAAALEASVRDRLDDLRRGLEKVAGALEMGVRIIDPAQARAAEPPDRSTGRAYLEALARREGAAKEARDRGDAVARSLTERLIGLVRDARVRPLGSGAGLAAVAYLVPRHDIGSYESAVHDFAARHEDLRFLFSGPWPPYGFADFADDERDGSA